jgi:hypothetical protein
VTNVNHDQPDELAGASAVPIRTQIDAVLARATQIEEKRDAMISAIGHRDVSAVEWEANNTAQQGLAAAAVGVLRELVTLVDRGDVAALGQNREPVPELIVMVWDGGRGRDEEVHVEGRTPPLARNYVEANFHLQPGQAFTVCPRCYAVNAEVYEISRGERWDNLELHPTGQPASRVTHCDGEPTYVPNPLAGLPMFRTWSDRDGGDFHTDRHQCEECGGEVVLPNWLEVSWS